MISVCMATYNGEKYIKKQLDSILTQLDKNDELIISDDSSTDRTIEIIKSFNDNNRIKLIESQKFKSPIFNFENALKQTTGDIIVLSDQDDIWENNKINVVRKSFMHEDFNKPILKMYNGKCIDKDDKIICDDLFKYVGIRKGLLLNTIKNSVIGCNIALTRKLLNICLPFPKDIPMHDIWIGSCAYVFGSVEFVNEKIFYYRWHNNNYTGKKTKLFKKFIWRFDLIKDLMERYINVKFRN